MSHIDLIILGYLQSGEKSAYDMVKEFETWNLRYWLKISDRAIYKNIIQLSENGYLDSRTIKESEMPEKTIYSINEKGLARFNELMEYSSSHIGNFYFDFNAFLCNLDRLPDDKKTQFIRNFRQNIVKCVDLMNSSYQNQLNNNEKPHSASLLLDLYKDFYDLLDKWSEKLLEHYDL